MTQQPVGSAPLPELVVRNLTRIAVTALTIGGLLIGVAVMVAVFGDVNKGELVAILASVGVLLNIASAAQGGLGAILASTRTAGDPPAPVTVVNAPADPVPTSDVPAPTKQPAAGERARRPAKRATGAGKKTAAARRRQTRT
jgi:hypothetical protein